MTDPTIVLITGANSGVGYAATQILAGGDSNYHVIMAGRSYTRIQTALSEIENSGIKGQLTALRLDVTDESSIKRAVVFVEEKFGKLDVLINNAAAGNVDPDPRTRFTACMETNVLGPFMVAQAFRPLLLKSPKPYSIYVSSGGGSLKGTAETPMTAFQPPNPEAYKASKAALNMVMIMDWNKSKSTAMKVFGMCPGFVVSNLRGTSEEMRTGMGQAGDPLVSGELIKSIIEGRRDADVGRVVKNDGVYPW